MEENKSKVVDLLEKELCVKTSFGGIVPAKEVLVFAPHPDDEVVGCGGTILRYLEAGAGVTIVYLTDGRYGVTGMNAAVRREEAENAWIGSGIRQCFWNFEDSHMDSNEVLMKISSELQIHKPDVIFSPWALDRHIDHKLTSRLLDKALGQLKGYFPVICLYEVMYPLYANKVVDITRQMETKLKMIDAYKTQKQYLNLKEVVLGAAGYRASIARIRFIKAAEAFFLCDRDVLERLMGKFFEE